MIAIPDRLSGLMARLEAGDVITREDLARIETLQALDVARIGEQFAQEAMARDDERTRDFANA